MSLTSPNDPHADRAYLSVVQWPDGWDDQACGNLLAHALGIDPYNAELIAKRGAPGVVALLTPEHADEALAYLRDRGVMANAPLRSTMQGLPRPEAIKRLFWTLHQGQPALGFERWRAGVGTPTEGVIEPEHLFLIVRAMTRSSERRVTAPKRRGMGGAATGFMVGGVAGAMIGGALSRGHRSPDISTRTHTAEAMELFIRSTSGVQLRLRISSGRFNADILAEHRGNSAKEYMQGIVSLLTKASPRSIVDTGFDEFRAPTDSLNSHYQASGKTSISKTTTAGAFDFYSEWVCLLYLSMMS